MKSLIFSLILVAFSPSAFAQIRGLPSIPTSGAMGLQGSVGVGFTDFNVGNPAADLKIDRGTYYSAAIERGFGAHFYLTLGLSFMTAEGTANYAYSNLSSSNSYALTDVSFKSTVTDLSLGLKFKLIDNFWFRPYVEGGGLGGYSQVTYGSKISTLTSQGTDYKSKDVVMGSGYYGEAGLEAMFSDRFGVKLAARRSSYQTKKLETLRNRTMVYQAETYYFALLFGF